MRYRGLLERPVRAKTDRGSSSVTWDAFGLVWFGREAVRGDERFLRNERFATTTHVLRIRFIPGVLPTFRVNHQKDGILYEIIGVLDAKGRKRELELLCREEPVTRG
jgi:SPP1 family predicted phage head-tail adaptor